MALFAEIFPINTKEIPILSAYRLTVTGSLSANEIGGKLRYRLQNKFGGHWYWDSENECLLTDKPINDKAIEQILGELWQETDITFQQNLESISHVVDASPSLQGVANFVAQALLDDVEHQIESTLANHRQDKNKYFINLICKRYGWVVDGQPAVSLSIRSNIDYKDDLKLFLYLLSRHRHEGSISP